MPPAPTPPPKFRPRFALTVALSVATVPTFRVPVVKEPSVATFNELPLVRVTLPARLILPPPSQFTLPEKLESAFMFNEPGPFFHKLMPPAMLLLMLNVLPEAATSMPPLNDAQLTVFVFKLLTAVPVT